MVYANCEIYENDKGEVGVLTRTDEWDENSFLEELDHNNYSVNLDRRLIEFYLSSPEHTFKAWNDLLEECGYGPLKDYGDYINEFEEKADDQIVQGFKLTLVPQDKLFRIGRQEVRTKAGNWLGMEQVVEIYDIEDFMET